MSKRLKRRSSLLSSSQAIGTDTGAFGFGSRRVGGDHRRASDIEQIIEEDLAAPLLFVKCCCEALRKRSREQIRDRFGKCLDVIPPQLGLDRHHHMQAFAAGRFDKGF